ncbi:MAG: AAC(3) family N-acetyltransferase [Lachnospiraceae bacterium]|nr:AAC(3) family N-acetyltransferase [Lachnospiraceae bacterium]
MRVITKETIVNELKKIGLEKNDIVMVHTSLKSMGYVCGGAQTIIEALIDVVGSKGTIMMPTQSWKNLDPETGVHWDADESDWQLIRDNWPAYDKDITPTNTMGAVAEMFRTWPGSIRSDHPARSVCAWGKHAAYLTQNHDLSDIFGETSPLAKLYELNGKVLLLGVGYDKNTSLHLADVRAEYPGKHNCTEYSAIMENGMRVWKKYDTLFVDGEDFDAIGASFEEHRNVKSGSIGNAVIRLMNQRELVDYAVQWIGANRK